MEELWKIKELAFCLVLSSRTEGTYIVTLWMDAQYKKKTLQGVYKHWSQGAAI